MTDDIRDDAPSDEDPTEDAPVAAEDDATETAPTAEEQVDWEKRYKDREKTVSRQGEEIRLMRAQVSALEQRMTTPAYEPPTPEEIAALPPSIAQELAYRRSRDAEYERTEVVTQYGTEFDQALEFYERAVNLDPSRKGRANAFMAAISRLADDAETESAPVAPKPKAPTRMESNRSDAAPPADLDKLAREAETKRDQKSLQAFLSEKLRAAGVR